MLSRVLYLKRAILTLAVQEDFNSALQDVALETSDFNAIYQVMFDIIFYNNMFYHNSCAASC